jgi:hypothetical protein
MQWCKTKIQSIEERKASLKHSNLPYPRKQNRAHHQWRFFFDDRATTQAAIDVISVFWNKIIPENDPPYEVEVLT